MLCQALGRRALKGGLGWVFAWVRPAGSSSSCLRLVKGKGPPGEI